MALISSGLFPYSALFNIVHADCHWESTNKKTLVARG
jgi:hypothetical protein